MKGLVIVLGASLTISLVGVGYLTAQQLSARAQLTESKLIIGRLQGEMEELIDKVSKLENVEAVDQVKLREALEMANEQMVIRDERIDQLTNDLREMRRLASNYRSRYMKEKKATKSAQRALDKKLAHEKAILEQQNEIALASQRSELEGEFSTAAERREAEQKVDEIMTSFTALKVDLDVVNTCDKAYLERYGEAKSMLNHMRTYIQKHTLSPEFYHFVIANDTQLTRQTRKICLEN